MKHILLTFSATLAMMLTSCVNPDGTTSSGQNRFGYNGTTSSDTQPTSGQNPSNTGVTTPTNNVANNTGTTNTSSQNTGEDTIPIDTLPSNNTTNTGETSSDNGNVASNDTTSSTNTDVDTTDKPDKPEYLYGIPVPGRDGMVYSPYNKDAGYIDVRGMTRGALAEDPYTPGKLFRVP